MSTQHTGRYTDEEVEELRTKWPLERIEAMVAEADAVADAAEADLLGSSEAADYESKTVAELTELLKERDLVTTGNKADLVARLVEADQAK